MPCPLQQSICHLSNGLLASAAFAPLHHSSRNKCNTLFGQSDAFCLLCTHTVLWQLT